MAMMLMEKVSDVAVKPFQFTFDYVAEGELKPIEVLPVVREVTLTERFKEAARVVIAEAGLDYRYEGEALRCNQNGCQCNGKMNVYIHNGRGSCLIGRILVQMGVDPIKVGSMERHPASDLIIAFFAPEDGARVLTPDVSRVANMAVRMQTANDAAQPWGHALQMMNEIL
jgi:hypothetical protein